jgi:hypothetical protein
VIHRVFVLRRLPQFGLRAMTAGASLAANERCDGRIAGVPGRLAAVQEKETCANCRSYHRGEQRRHNDLQLQSPPPFLIISACFGAIDPLRSGGRF